MKRYRSYFSGFGSSPLNHELWLKGQRIAKKERDKKAEPITSFNDPRFVSMREQLEKNAAK